MKIREFINSIRGLSENTIRVYEQSLYQLAAHVSGEEPTPDEIRHFLSKYQTSSMHRHKAAIKTYLEWQGKAWPFGRREFPVRRRDIPRYISPEKVEKLAAAGEDKHDEMFVKALFQLGARISELMNITDTGISPSGIKLKTKGGHHKIRPITKEFYQELARYVGKRKGRIFNKPYAHYYKQLKKMGAIAGVPEVSPHMLRHSRAVDLLRKGMSPVFVQQFLGHANFNTTAIYLEITGGELANELERVESNGNSKL